MTSLARLVAESDVPELHENSLPMPHIAYGLIAFGVFLAMLGFLFFFRHADGIFGDPKALRRWREQTDDGHGHGAGPHGNGH